MPQSIPLDCVFYIKGYFSEKQLDCFVWEEDHFEDGEQVIFGTSGRLGCVLRGVQGWKELCHVQAGRHEVLALPISFQLSWTQHIIMCYF